VVGALLSLAFLVTRWRVPDALSVAPVGTAEGVCVMANSTARIKQLTAELLQHLGCFK